MKRLLSVFMAVAMLLSMAACGGQATGDSSEAGNDQVPTEFAPVTETYADAVHIALSDGMTDAPEGVTVSNDIIYYEEGHDFKYGEGTEDDAHSAEEAAAHTVVTITEPGQYLLTGALSAGQLAVDLGEDAEEDPDAVVTLILGGVDITCTVAPAVIFYNVYECADKDDATKNVDTSAAGANVIIADGTVNNIAGSYVARIYKSVVLSDDGKEVVDSKKLHKYDGAFYSKMSMNVDGGEYDMGTLNITAENEGLDSELHLTINGGIIHINSGNDGINTNEDGVSVTTVNGGTLEITVNGSTGEGDGIDSNGWLVINGGTVIAEACATSGDAGIDSDMGIYLNGGTVFASGNMLDAIAGGNGCYAVFEFAQRMQGGQTMTLKNAEGEQVLQWAPMNDFQYLVMAAPALTAGDYTLWADDIQLSGSSGFGGMMGMGGGRGQGGMRPEDMEEFDPSAMELPEGMEEFDPSQMEGTELPEGFDPTRMQRPDGMQLPEGMEEFDPSAMELPEGMENMTPPDGEMPEMPQGGGRGQGGQQQNTQQSTTFTIPEGGARFLVQNP